MLHVAEIWSTGRLSERLITPESQMHRTWPLLRFNIFQDLRKRCLSVAQYFAAVNKNLFGGIGSTRMLYVDKVFKLVDIPLKRHRETDIFELCRVGTAKYDVHFAIRCGMTRFAFGRHRIFGGTVLGG